MYKKIIGTALLTVMLAACGTAPNKEDVEEVEVEKVEVEDINEEDIIFTTDSEITPIENEGDSDTQDSNK